MAITNLHNVRSEAQDEKHDLAISRKHKLSTIMANQNLSKRNIKEKLK